MSQAGERQTYTKGLIALHWLMAVLLVLVMALMEFRDIYPKGSDGRAWMAAMHFSFGLMVLALVAIRVLVRLGQSEPPIVPAPPHWSHLAARVGHLAFYALMIAMPILGWLALSGMGKPIAFFGVSLPALIAENKDLGHDLGEVHETLSKVFYAVIVIHVAGVLAHQFVWKDNTLQRMRPQT